MLTLPQNADAEIHGPAERTETADQDWLTRTSENVWKLGKGGRKYVFSSIDGSLMIRSRDLIAER